MALEEGWSYVLNWNMQPSHKWHYFVNHESLCGRWMKFTNDGLEQGNDKSPDNCKICMKKLEKMNAS